MTGGLCPDIDLAILVLTAVVVLVGCPEAQFLIIVELVGDVALDEQVTGALTRCLDMVGEGRDVDGVGASSSEDLL